MRFVSFICLPAFLNFVKRVLQSLYHCFDATNKGYFLLTMGRKEGIKSSFRVKDIHLGHHSNHLRISAFSVPIDWNCFTLLKA